MPSFSSKRGYEPVRQAHSTESLDEEEWTAQFDLDEYNIDKARLLILYPCCPLHPRLTTSPSFPVARPLAVDPDQDEEARQARFDPHHTAQPLMAQTFQVG